MTTYWMLETGGKPLETVQQFLRDVYHNAGLSAMLLPLCDGEDITSEIVEDVKELNRVNPFLPLMHANAASQAAEFAEAQPETYFGAVLRACEVRALLEVARRRKLDLKRVLILGVDCLGTFPESDFSWRGSVDKLTGETFQFARQGGVNVHRYRPACQMCTELVPEQADLIIDILGLPARQHVMITIHDQALAETLDLRTITSGEATRDLIKQHDRIRSIVAGRRARARERIVHSLQTELVMTVDALVEHLAECKPCRECLDACPIYATVRELSRDSVIDWLTSCAGCGMCEQVCPDHLPLAAIFSRLRDEISDALAASQRETSGNTMATVDA